MKRAGPSCRQSDHRIDPHRALSEPLGLTISGASWGATDDSPAAGSTDAAPGATAGDRRSTSDSASGSGMSPRRRQEPIRSVPRCIRDHLEDRFTWNGEVTGHPRERSSDRPSPTKTCGDTRRHRQTQTHPSPLHQLHTAPYVRARCPEGGALHRRPVAHPDLTVSRPGTVEKRPARRQSSTSSRCATAAARSRRDSFAFGIRRSQIRIETISGSRRQDPAHTMIRSGKLAPAAFSLDGTGRSVWTPPLPSGSDVRRAKLRSQARRRRTTVVGRRPARTAG